MRPFFLKVRTMLAEAIKVNRRITPAGEWLLDNFYLIEEQIRTARRHLPKGYSRELPRLRNGPSAGLPRVYDIALETISHGDGRVDPENLSSFVAAYQSVSILKLGELWAIPIMLRLALIENLRRVASRIASDMAEQNRADYWADRMIETAEKDPKSLILVIAEMVRSDPPMVSSFVAELARRLQGQSSNLALPLTWIEQRLSESGSTIKQLVHSEIQQQAADQVSMSNSFGSLRFLSAMDWHEFVETMSVVDQTLGEDPGGFYRKMDFTTRDRYRHVIEKIARGSGLSEAEVARKAILLSQEGAAGKGRRRSGRPCRLLPDRQWIGAARAIGRSAHIRFQGPSKRNPPVSPVHVHRLDHAARGDVRLRTSVEGAWRRAAGMAIRAVRYPLVFMRDTPVGRARELGGDASCDAASAAAPGLFRRESRRNRRHWSWSRPCSRAIKTSRT